MATNPKTLFLYLKPFVALAIALLLFSIKSSIAQNKASNRTGYDAMYGLDPRLVTGAIYDYPYYGIDGHPYLDTKNFVEANIWMNGMEFIHQKLTYDIYNNKVILEVTSNEGAIRHIQLLDSLVDSFYVESKLFVKKDLPNHGIKFCESIKHGEINFLIYYFKTFNKKPSTESFGNTFSEQKSLLFYLDQKNIDRVRSKRKFYRLFKDEKLIKKLSKNNKLVLKNIDKNHLIKLLSRYNKLAKLDLN